MDVACSTIGFTREPLEQALRHIAVLEFSKVDIAISPESPHASVAQVATDPNSILGKIRQAPTIGFAALTLRFDTAGEALFEQLDAVAHFAKQLSTPVLVVEAAPVGSDRAEEISRLTEMERIASLHGSILTVTTKTGTLTETPEVAVELCKAVPGLGICLDPSHYVCGPHQGKSYDEVFPYVRHAHLRDSGRTMDQFQVKVGRGEIEYGRIVTSLKRFNYRGSLTVAIDDTIPSEMDYEAEVRKLLLLIESLI